MNYYVDDVFFATLPDLSQDTYFQFQKEWPFKNRNMQHNLDNDIYFVQDYKKKSQVSEKLIPSLNQHIVPEASYNRKFILFSIVRELVVDSPYRFDYVSEKDKNYLRNFLYFTVLFHPTPFDLAYCARILYKDKNRIEIDRIIPNTHLGNGSQFEILSKEGYESFLTPQDLHDSYCLYCMYLKAKKEKKLRPKNLILLIDYYLSSFWTNSLEISLIIIVSALEALFNTVPKGKPGITIQFEKRIEKVSKELKRDGYLTKSVYKRTARKIYGLRCEYTHRGVFIKKEKDYHKNIKYLETSRRILSGVIRKCIDDPNYGKIFNSRNNIDNTWPV